MSLFKGIKHINHLSNESLIVDQQINNNNDEKHKNEEEKILIFENNQIPFLFVKDEQHLKLTIQLENNKDKELFYDFKDKTNEKTNAIFSFGVKMRGTK